MFKRKPAAAPATKPDAAAENKPGCGCGCVTLWLVLVVLYVAQLQWKFHQRDVRNKAFVVEAAQIADALEAHARANGGLYPAAEQLRAAVQPRLPGQAWPNQRWAWHDAAPAPLAVVTPNAEMTYRDGPATLPLLGTASAGRLPSPGPGHRITLAYGTSQPGVLIYETDRARRHYVLYGVGGYALSDSPDGGVELPAIRLVRTNRR